MFDRSKVPETDVEKVEEAVRIVSSLVGTENIVLSITKLIALPLRTSSDG